MTKKRIFLLIFILLIVILSGCLNKNDVNKNDNNNQNNGSRYALQMHKDITVPIPCIIDKYLG